MQGSFAFPTTQQALRRRDRLLGVLFALLAVVLVARAARQESGVLLRNQQFGARFLERMDPYYDPDRGERIHGPYPPSLALVAAPLSLLPTPVARVVWAAAQVAALAALFVLLRARLRTLAPALAQHAPLLFAAALVLASRYLLRDMAGGGGNLLYGTFAYAGLELAWRGRGGAAGLALALALALKPNLAPLALFLGLRGRWSALASTLACTALFFALPGLYYGPRAYARLAATWADGVARYAALEDLHASGLVPDGMPPAEHAMNQSLRDSVHRLLRPPGDSGADDVHLVLVSPAAAAWVARLAALALFLAAVWATRRARDPRAEWLAGLAWLPLCLLLSPITWKAHHVVLLPLFFVLCACAAEHARRPRWLVPGLWLYWVLCDVLSTELVGDRAGDWLQAISLVAWADVALFCAALTLARAGASSA